MECFIKDDTPQQLYHSDTRLLHEYIYHKIRLYNIVRC